MGHRFTPPSTPSRAAAASKGRVTNILDSINSFWGICARKASRATKKLAPDSPRSPLAKPKQILSTISSKAMHFRGHKKKLQEDGSLVDDVDFGDGGLWQRNILMGDKCQPLEFSGVIYYDSNGKRLDECPMKSPRASPLPSYLFNSSEGGCDGGRDRRML